MKNKIRVLGLCALLLTWCGLAGCATSGTNDAAEQASASVELTVSAAASLQDAMDELSELYRKEKPEIEIHLNYGSSGTLQKQIEQGAPVDVFLSAGASQMEALANQSLLLERKALLLNELVLIGPATGDTASIVLEDLAADSVKRIAIGQPESVPAGQYAKESLERAGLWEQMKGKLVFAKDVRQVLTYVEGGNVDAGFVYRTDALTTDKAKISLVIDEDLHRPIVYPAAVLKGSKHPAEALDFYQFLQGKEALNIFEKYGFTAA